MMSADELAQHLLEHRPAFLAFLRRRVGNPDLAADLLQDSLLKALRHSAQLRARENLIAWFFRLLRHAVIDLYRRRAARERSLRSLQTELARAPTAADERSLCACLRTLLPTLKPDYAELIRRVDLDQQPVTAVARHLGVTPNNLGVRLHRARRQLRTRLIETCRVCARHHCLDCDCRT